MNYSTAKYFKNSFAKTYHELYNALNFKNLLCFSKKKKKHETALNTILLPLTLLYFKMIHYYCG